MNTLKAILIEFAMVAAAGRRYIFWDLVAPPGGSRREALNGKDPQGR